MPLSTHLHVFLLQWPYVTQSGQTWLLHQRLPKKWFGCVKLVDSLLLLLDL